MNRLQFTLTRIVLLLAGLAGAASAEAQEFAPDPHETPIPALLDRYQRELVRQQLRSETGGILHSMITGRVERFPRARVDSLLAGLEAIVYDGTIDSDIHADAASLLAMAGAADLPRPRPGNVGRLMRIYRQVNDEAVRGIIVTSLAYQAERAPALAALRRIAEKEEDSYPKESWTALRYLLAAGEDGKRVIREMHRARSAKNPFVAGLIEQYVRHDFRLPGPGMP